MIRLLLRAGVLGAVVAFGMAACASTPAYVEADCPVYTGLDAVRANPAGALDRHLVVEAGFRVCPPGDGLAEIQRKHIELKHEILALLSAKSEAELRDPLRVEKLEAELERLVNDRIMRKGRVLEVFITAFELQ